MPDQIDLANMNATDAEMSGVARPVARKVGVMLTVSNTAVTGDPTLVVSNPIFNDAITGTQYLDDLTKLVWIKTGPAAGNWVLDVGGGGVTAFTALTDTPANYVGQALSFLQVVAAENAVGFVANVLTATTAPIVLYVRATGDDANNGSEGSPIRTSDEVKRRIPYFRRHGIDVHLRGEAYVLPVDGQWIPAGAYDVQAGGYINVFADEVWDPTVRTQDPGNPFTCDSGTGDNQIMVTVTAGLAKDEWAGRSVLMLPGGGAAGRLMHVTRNDATAPAASGAVILTAPFSQAGLGVAAPGDTFDVFDADGCSIVLPVGGPGVGLYELAGRQTGGGPNGSNEFRDSGPTLVFQGIKFEGSDGSWDHFVLIGEDIYMYGCSEGTFTGGDAHAFTLGFGRLFMGSKAATWNPAYENVGPVDRLHEGWGLVSSNRPPRLRSDTRMNGYLWTTEDFIAEKRAIVEVLGGRVGRWLGAYGNLEISYGEEAPGGPGVHSDMGSDVWFQLSSNDVIGLEGSANNRVYWSGVHVASMGNVGATVGRNMTLEIRGDGDTTIKATTPGNVVMDIKEGAQVLIKGSPEGIGESTVAVPAADDWKLDGVLVNPVTDLLVTGDFIPGAKGSFIRRI